MFVVKNLLSARWRQYAGVFAATLSMFSCGMHLVWTSAALPKLYDPSSHIRITVTDGSWLASFEIFGELLCAPVATYITDAYGRKPTIYFSMIFFTLSWIAIFLANSRLLLYLGRLFVGIGESAALTVLPIYVAETTDADIRGRLGNLLAIQMDVGSLFMYVVGPFVSIRTMALIGLVPPFGMFVLLPFFSESPYFFWNNGNERKAQNALKKLKGRKDVDEELRSMGVVVEKGSSQSTWRELFSSKSNVRALIISLGLVTVQETSGEMAVLVFAQPIFSKTNGILPDYICAMLVGLMQVISALGSYYLVDRIGKRPLLITSCFLCMVSQVSLATYFYAETHLVWDLTNVSWLPVVCLCTFISSFSFGTGAVALSMPGELFPINVKAKASLLLYYYMAILSCVVTASFLPIVEYMGIMWPFLAFGVCNGIAVVFAWAFVLETKGRSLEEIQGLLRTDSLFVPRVFR